MEGSKSAAEIFTAMLEKANQKSQLQEAENHYRETRYAFAMKVAAGQEPSLTDLLAYLTAYTEYYICLYARYDCAAADQIILKQACREGKPSSLLEAQLRKRIRAKECSLAVAQRVSNVLFLNSFYQNILLCQEAVSDFQDIASEAPWLPYEIKGLKLCLRFFDAAS